MCVCVGGGGKLSTTGLVCVGGGQAVHYKVGVCVCVFGGGQAVNYKVGRQMRGGRLPGAR